MRAEMMALVSQGASVDPNRQVPDASSGHRAFRESAKDENPYTPPPEDQTGLDRAGFSTKVGTHDRLRTRDLWEKTGLESGSRFGS
ncbi:hypothetical protein ACSBR2_034326 [Camellia fascicularis]